MFTLRTFIPFYFKDDTDLPVIQEKMYNLISLLNAAAIDEDPKELERI
jgi:hypothetical protein